MLITYATKSSHIHMGLTSCATGRKIISCRNRGIWQKASIAYIGCTASEPPPLCETNLHPILLTSSHHVVGHSTLRLTSPSHLSTTSCAFEGHYNMFVLTRNGYGLKMLSKWACFYFMWFIMFSVTLCHHFQPLQSHHKRSLMNLFVCKGDIKISERSSLHAGRLNENPIETCWRKA